MNGIRLESERDPRQQLELLSLLPKEGDLPVEFWKQIAGKWSGRWCYVQYIQSRLDDPSGSETLWIWDAQDPCREPLWWSNRQLANVESQRSAFYNAAKHVLAIAEWDASNGWRTLRNEPALSVSGGVAKRLLRIATGATRNLVTANPARPIATGPHATVGPPHLFEPSCVGIQLATITSLHPGRTARAIKEIAQSLSSDPAIYVDLFAFMHREPILKYAFRHFSNGPSIPTAIDLMALASNRNDMIQFIASMIVKLCERREQNTRKPIRLVAMSTFVPEISSPINGIRERGINACAFAVRLAKQISQVSEGRHHIRAVEMVCGTRLRGIGRAKELEGNSEVYFAARQDEEVVLDTIVTSLQQIVERSGLSSEDRCPLAIELEPGPLYAMNNVGMLAKLSARLDNDWRTRNTTGFNCDFAHFFLAEANIDELLSAYRKAIGDKIVHAHISDHGPGVFGDISLARDVGSSRETGAIWLRRWLKFIHDLRPEGRSSGQLPFSGFVSLELEAVKTMEMVRSSFEEFRAWQGTEGILVE